MKKLLFLSAVALLSFNCSESDVDETPSDDPQDETTTLSIEVSAPSYTSTRIDVTEGSDAWSVAWESTDKIGAWSTGESSQSRLTIDGDVDGNKATFTGELEGEDLRLIYPYSASAISNSTYSLSLASQSVKVDDVDNNIGKYSYMINDSLIADGAATTTATMEHLATGVVLDVEFTNIEEGYTAALQSLVVGSDDSTLLPSAASIDLTKAASDSSIYSATTEGAIALTITSNTVANGDTRSIPFCAFPFEMSSDATITCTATFVFTDAEGTIYNVEQAFDVANTTGGAISLARGAFTTLEATCDLDGVELGDPVVDEPETPEGYAWVNLLIDADFENGLTSSVIGTGYSELEIAAGEGVDGSAALKVVNPSPDADKNWIATIKFVLPDSEPDIAAGEVYNVSLTVKSSEDALMNGIQIQDASGTLKSTISPYNFTTSTGWTTKSFTIDVDALLEAGTDITGGRMLAFCIGQQSATFHIDNCEMTALRDENYVPSNTVIPDDSEYEWSELIANGDFENGASAQVYAAGDANPTSEIAAGEGVDGSAAFKVTNSAVQDNDYMSQIMINLTEDNAFAATDEFIVSFDVRSDDGVAISSASLQAPASNSWYNGGIDAGVFTATSSWTTISYKLSASTTTEASKFAGAYIIAMNFGFSTGTIYIDNVSVQKKGELSTGGGTGGGDDNTGDDDNTGSNEGTELISGGDFEGGETSSVNTNYSKSTGALSADGEGYGGTGYAYVVSNSSVQTNDYDAQFAFHLSSTDALAVGDTLRISFNVRSENGSSLTGMQFGCNESPWYLCSVGGDTVSTSSEWSTVSFDVVLDETSVLVAKFAASIGSTVDTFYIDNCSVKHIAAN